MTDEQMAELRQRFDEVNERFNAVDRHVDLVDRRFDTVDRRFDGVDERLEDVDQRLDGVDGRLNSLDAELHRQGLLLESNTQELKLATESFQGLQRLTIAKIDDVRERIQQRIEPLEIVFRTHSAQLAEHGRRLDEREQ